MMHQTQQNPNTGDTTTDGIIEFRADDDAWYSVRLVLSGDTLTVKYCNFPDVYDERFNANGFKILKEVDDFEERFRPMSVQLQDSDCREVIEGVMVCASLVFSEEDVRFYDACVEEVEYKEHTFANGEEECLCEFMLFWQHGPHAGNLTSTSVEHICLIQPCMQIDPTIASFLKTVRDKVKNISSNADLISGDSGCKDGAIHKEIWSSYFRHKSIPKETKCPKRSESITQATEGRMSILREWIEEDIDLGGEALVMKNFKETKNKHILLIENLEKDLSQSTLVEFILKQTDISTEAFLLPSLSSETYTRGMIVVDYKDKLEKLCVFLDNPGHLIVSSKGRPWVISEKVLMPTTFGVSFVTVMPNSEKNTMKGNPGNCDELRVVLSDNEEYMTAKRLRDLLTNFLDHQKRMHKKLDLEETKCAKRSESLTQATEGRMSILREWIEEDTDLGSEALFTKNFEETGKKHVLLIENLEKDLSQSSLVEFILKQIDISTEAFVLPSLSSETYTRGIIVVDCKEKLAKLYAFLDNPGHLIVSSRGRPWVIPEKVLMPNTFGVSFVTVMSKSQKNTMKGNTGNCDELRVVLSGNEEYMTAKKLRDLLTNFLDHQKRMHKKLDLEARKILQLSRAV